MGYRLPSPPPSERLARLIDQSIHRIQQFEPPDKYWLAFSGGKDSQCIYHLSVLAGVAFEAHYSITSVDPPELVRFIRKNYPDVYLDVPHDLNGKPITMWRLIEEKMIPPTRIARYCCAELKESQGKGRVTMTGVRWAESIRRRNSHGVVDVGDAGTKHLKRIKMFFPVETISNNRLIMNMDNDEAKRIVEHCFRTDHTTVNPIIDWTEEDVWSFLNDVMKVEHCCLYDDGHQRIGCIGCPMASYERRHADFERWPQYKTIYLHAFDRMIKRRTEHGKSSDCWDTAQNTFDWWLEDRPCVDDIKEEQKTISDSIMSGEIFE